MVKDLKYWQDKNDRLLARGGQTDKAAAFEHEVCGFQSSHRRSAYPLSSPRLAEAYSLNRHGIKNSVQPKNATCKPGVSAESELCGTGKGNGGERKDSISNESRKKAQGLLPRNSWRCTFGCRERIFSVFWCPSYGTSIKTDQTVKRLVCVRHHSVGDFL